MSDLVKVSCPGCGATFELSPELAGEVGECAECGTSFTIPDLEDTIKVACPGCDTIFDLPRELAGELGECTECQTVFEIPSLAEIEAVEHGSVAQAPPAPAAPAAPATQEESSAPDTPATDATAADAATSPQLTDTGAFKARKTESEATNTVKLSRSSVGMIPNVKDNFNFDVVKKDAPPQTPGASKKTMKKPTMSAPKPKKKPEAKKTPPPKVKKKWWQFWK